MILPGTGRVAARRCAPLVATVVLAASVAGCTGSKGTSAASSSPATVTSGGTTSGSPSASSAGLSASDVVAIKKAYTTLIDSTTSTADSIAVLQDGAAFKDTLDAQAKSPQAQDTTATVSRVTAQSPNTAVVIFTILLKGSQVLKDTPGFAVRENGRWKVAGGTFCGLLTLNGGAPPVCKTAAATALPG
ncbi:MAG: hypothetical protein QOH14_2172 [Pseudonocardiales bacterium]|nr:hypothetical protein [Pseudonocardiales bacterium]